MVREKVDDELKDEALHFAIHNQEPEAMEKLLEMGANVFIRRKWGTVLKNLSLGFPLEGGNDDDEVLSL